MGGMAAWDNLAVVASDGSDSDGDEGAGKAQDTELSWASLAAKGVAIRQLSVPRYGDSQQSFCWYLDAILQAFCS